MLINTITEQKKFRQWNRFYFLSHFMRATIDFKPLIIVTSVG